MPQTTIPAGEFKAKCLKLMDEVSLKGTEIVITKRGKPVARLVPPEPPEKPADIFGHQKGSITILGDIVSPIDVAWDAEK